MGATAVLVVLLWLLLFVAPALFNAHTRTGLWAALSLFLATPALIAAVIDGLGRRARLTTPGDIRAQGEDDVIG
ncbi:hypothetical protein ACLB0R_03860 [Sphingomonas sp. GlSt437]